MDTDQRRLFFAVGLSALILFSWQYFFGHASVVEEKVASSVAQSSSPVPTTEKAPIATESHINDDNVSYDVKSSDGRSVRLSSSLALLDFESKSGRSRFKDIVGPKVPFQLLIKEQDQIKKIFLTHVIRQSEGELEIGTEDGGFLALLKIRSNGVVDWNIKSKTEIKPILAFKSEKAENEHHQSREYVVFSENVERFKVADSDKWGEANSSWVGVDYFFHLFSIGWPQKQAIKYSVNTSGEMVVELLKPAKEFSFEVVYTLKNYDYLSSLGNNLKQSVDFGFFGILAVPILKTLEFFYHYVSNYGIAIILLTMLLRLITFPLQFHSFKNMKKMQKITPEMNKIREMYKGDPQKLQQETMQLFKRTGANPWSGCLPLLLQLPIFVAFYKVLYNAVELMGAPFYGWIKDLGAKDPYFVLPVLMTGAMFLQQKMTPSATVDPSQQKVMLFMPLVFGFIMKDLPSGLSLYIFVSTLLGILQQVFVNKRVA